MTNEVVQEFFRQRPASSPKACTSIENITRENHPKTFTGTTHAEATLMGLLTDFSSGLFLVNYGVQIEEVSLRFFKGLIEPVCYFLLPILLPLKKILGYRQHLRSRLLLAKIAVML